MRNPFTPWRVSQGWSPAHPAVDYATPVGTEFTAPASGVYLHLPSELSRVPGAAGHYGDLRLDDGRRIRVCHLDHHIAAHGARVIEGVTILAATGNSGYVLPTPTRADPHAGAHMHTTGFHADGTRWNWTLDTQGDDMLDANDQKWLNGMGQSIIDQVVARVTAKPVTIDYDKLADAIVRRAMKP